LLDLASAFARFMGGFIVRAFVRLRSLYAAHVELTRRLDELVARVSGHDVDLRTIIEVVRQLALPDASDRRPIGYGESENASRTST